MSERGCGCFGGCGDDFIWIIILVVLFCCCGGGFGRGGCC
jgi:hypothetical protein